MAASQGRTECNLNGLLPSASCVFACLWAPLCVPTPRLHYGWFTLTLHCHSALAKQASSESRREPEKKAASKQSGSEQKTSHLSQAHLLAGAVKRRRYVHKYWSFTHALVFFPLWLMDTTLPIDKLADTEKHYYLFWIWFVSPGQCKVSFHSPFSSILVFYQFYWAKRC